MNYKFIILSAICGLLLLTGCEKAKEAAETTRDTADAIAGKAGEAANAVAKKAGEIATDAGKMADDVKDVVAGSQEAYEAALNAAKAATAEAAETGNEWRDTGKLLKAAEKAASEGDLEQAIKLASQARVQSEQAVIQGELMQNAGPLF